ncbi:hypothetical protein DUI87_02089 [Hirundo rustica rustica]|uniref:Uncharacterized protein n=1 Tax=Hirundo rustica rustica TaxID=333673 RepID=A0A3M0L815_HIRRU|nr:hypothetical protein DUI87_02089 [Hirundo rustica rustica]
MINGTNYEKAIQISVSTSADYHREICDRLSKSDCWYNFTLVQTVNVICLWGRGNKGLTFKFKITTTPIATTKSTVTQAQTTPPKIEHKIYEIGPYVIRNMGQQQLLFNPEWSLKRIEVLMQTNISEIQPACSSFLRTSSEGWTTWLQKQVHFRGRMRRDLTGILGTGLGVLNGIDSEILMNKLATATNDLVKLRQPLQSSLLALGTSQWEISKILPKWKEAEDQDHKLIINALNIAQNNVSLALSCIQAQLWIQSIVALVVREGNEGTFPIEIRKIVWDNASNLERKLQSWWTLVNFTYDPTTKIATTFVLTVRNATIYNIHPIIALGLNHEKTVLYPSEHRAWARIMNEKWQTVNLESCVTREQQGFICETNMIDAQDICLDTEQNICHFEIHPDTSQKTMLVYIGLGCQHTTAEHHLIKREPFMALTIATLLTIGGIRARTGVASLINQQKEMKTLRMSVDEDLGRIEQAIDGATATMACKHVGHPLLTGSSNFERLQLTEDLHLKDNNGNLVSVDNSEQGTWPRDKGKLIVVGDCKHTPKEIEILPGTLDNNPGKFILWLRWTHPPTFLPKGQIIAQIIPTWERPEEDNIPTACPVCKITEVKPQVGWFELQEDKVQRMPPWRYLGLEIGDSPDFFRDVSNDLTLIVNLKAALRGIKLPAYATLIG